MRLTIRKLKEIIKDLPDTMPVTITGRYVDQDDMQGFNIYAEEDILDFELCYAFDGTYTNIEEE